SMVMGLMSGLGPAWWSTRMDPANALNEGGRNSNGPIARRFRGALIVVEAALALALLLIGSLMMRSYGRLQSVPLGFMPDNILTAQIALPSSKYASPARTIGFFRTLTDRLRSDPSVINAAMVTLPPSSPGDWPMDITIEGPPAADGQPQKTALANAATPRYFSTMGIPLLDGHEFEDWDVSGKPLELVVTRSFARGYWPNEDPIGKRFQPGSNNPFGTVVGVVGDTCNINRPDEVQPAFYFPYGYIAMPAVVLTVRCAGSPENLAPILHAEVQGIDPDQPIYNIRTMSDVVSRGTAEPRFRTILLGMFGLVALLLSAVGIYSVVAYLAGCRRKEVALRMALGARARDVVWMIVGQGIWSVLLGVGLGLAGSVALGRLMQGLFFHVSVSDPLTYTLAPLLLIGVAFAGCYIPALRAAKADPVSVLRDE
ncbi:MAG TPA: FtsX-like permease family protein, partial [Blastocatellia bacterium]